MSILGDLVDRLADPFLRVGANLPILFPVLASRVLQPFSPPSGFLGRRQPRILESEGIGSEFPEVSPSGFLTCLKGFRGQGSESRLEAQFLVTTGCCRATFWLRDEAFQGFTGFSQSTERRNLYSGPVDPSRLRTLYRQLATSVLIGRPNTRGRGAKPLNRDPQTLSPYKHLKPIPKTQALNLKALALNL